MFQTIRPLALGLTCAAATAGALLFVQSHSQAQAPAATEAAPAAWDYRTQQVEISVLQSTLVTLGREGWELVTILHVDQTVEDAADGRPHLRAGRVEIVAKKLLRN